MEMLLQSNEWTCLPTAFAMVTDSLPKDIFDFLGHDGSDIIWPELDEPYCRRAFSIEEMIDYCISVICYPVEISPMPEYAPEGESRLFKPYPNDDASKRFGYYLKSKPAVLLGTGRGDKPHAVAWCNRELKIFDPSWGKLDISDFRVESGFFIF